MEEKTLNFIFESIASKPAMLMYGALFGVISNTVLKNQDKKHEALRFSRDNSHKTRDKIYTAISELQRDAIKFWTHSAESLGEDNNILSTKIKVQCNQVKRLIKELYIPTTIISKIEMSYMNFHKNVQMQNPNPKEAGYDFESKNRQAISDTACIINSLSEFEHCIAIQLKDHYTKVGTIL